MKIRRNNRESGRPVNSQETPATSQELMAAQAACETFWNTVRSGRPKMFKGFVASFTKDNAAKVHLRNGGQGRILSVKRENGEWSVEQTTYRPTYENEGFGLTLFEHVKYPLSSDGQVLVEQWVGRRMQDEQFTEDQLQAVMSSGTVSSRLTQELQQNIQHVLRSRQTSPAA